MTDAQAYMLQHTLADYSPLSAYVSVSLSLSLPLSLSISISPSLSMSLCVSLSLSVSFCLSLSYSITHSLCVSVSVSLSLSPPILIYLYFEFLLPFEPLPCPTYEKVTNNKNAFRHAQRKLFTCLSILRQPIQ